MEYIQADFPTSERHPIFGFIMQRRIAVKAKRSDDVAAGFDGDSKLPNLGLFKGFHDNLQPLVRICTHLIAIADKL